MKKIKRTSKKLMSVLLSILMIMSVLGMVGYASDYQCECGVNSFYYVSGENYAYQYCTNCGKKTVSCDHRGYDYIGYRYDFYCNVDEVCDCGHAVISGTKHQLGEYVKPENGQRGYFPCELCGDKIHTEEISKNHMSDNGDGTYSCEWIEYDDETGAVIGSGEAYYKNRILTISGTGACDAYRIMEETVGFSKCENGWGHEYGIKSITDKVIIEEGITYLTDFPSISFVEEIVLPETLEGMRYEFFAPYAKVNIPSKLKLEQGLYVKEFIVDKNNPNFTLDKNGSLYNKDMTVLHAYNGNEKEVKIPSTVKEIGARAFMGNEYIEKVTVPSSVKKIGKQAFGACVNLKTVSLSYGLEEIDEYAFAYCFNLEEMVMPDSVTLLGTGAFEGCLSLKYVKLSENLKDICDNAFGTCFDLKVITIPSSVEKIGSEAFFGCYYLEEINIYSDSADIEDSAIGLIGGYTDEAFKAEFTEVFKELVKIEIGMLNSEDYDIGNYLSPYEYANCKMQDLAKKFDDLRYRLFNSYQPPVASDILTIYCNEGSTAEAYAIANGLKYVSEVCEHSFGEWVADEENGIRYKTCSKCGKTYEEELEADDDTIGIEGNEGDNKFTVEYIDNPKSPEYLYVRNTLEGNILAVYDINLLDENGNKVQPDGKVKVSLPLSEDVEYFVVLRINDDGSYTDMNAVREGNSAVFETDHFSYYVILGGENEADIGNNIKCECLCHKTPLLEIIMRIFKMLAKFLGTEITFPCDC